MGAARRARCARPCALPCRPPRRARPDGAQPGSATTIRSSAPGSPDADLELVVLERDEAGDRAHPLERRLVGPGGVLEQAAAHPQRPPGRLALVRARGAPL